MKQEERDEILIKILNTQEKLIKGQEDLNKRQEDTEKVINKILNEQEKMSQNQEKLFKEQEELFKGQEELFKNQKQMQEELTRVGNTVAKIEYEHGRKIDLILDVLTGHGEKLEEHDKRFEKDEKIIKIHGCKIFGIEQKMNT